MDVKKILSAAVLLLVTVCHSQNREGLGKAETAKVISEYSEILKQVYFDAERAEVISAVLQKGTEDGIYNGLSSAALANKLTETARQQTSDIHFYVGVAEKESINTNISVEPEQKVTNGGFAEVRVLPGNIGYIKWTGCMGDEESLRTITSALATLQKCSSLIIDVSENPGGDGRSCAYVNQYLYRDKDYQELLQKRCTGEPDWHRSEEVYEYNGGPKLFDIPLYIIISGNTASAAEYFALTAQEMKRAKILGRTTAGAGNPVTMVSFGDYFAYIPICQIKTQSGKSIEGTGVKPDVALSSDKLLQETLQYISNSK